METNGSKCKREHYHSKRNEDKQQLSGAFRSLTLFEKIKEASLGITLTKHIHLHWILTETNSFYRKDSLKKPNHAVQSFQVW